MARPIRPKGYLTKGKTKSADAARKASARRELTTLKGIGGIVGNAILEGVGGPKAKASSKVMLAVRREMRKKAAGIGQRKVTTSGQAKLVSSQMAKAPVKRTRDIVKKDSGRGLSASEKQQVTKRDTITRPKPNKPKTKEQIAFDKKQASGRTIRKSLTIQVNPARPKITPKRSIPVVSAKPKRTVQEIRNTLKGKKVKTGDKMRMDAQEYFDTRLAQKAAGKDSRNMLRPTSRGMETEKAAGLNKQRAREERLLRRSQRKEYRRDVRASQANPNRYSNPKQEQGNRMMTERNVDVALQEIKKTEMRKALERAKIAKTPKVQKKVDETLSAAEKARAIAARRNRIDARKRALNKRKGA